jgi:hypothetical protein
MSTVTLALSDELETALAQRVEAVGAASTEEYLLQLVEEDCAQSELERILLERSEGPFIPLDPAWREKVMEKVRERIRA